MEREEFQDLDILVDLAIGYDRLENIVKDSRHFPQHLSRVSHVEKLNKFQLMPQNVRRGFVLAKAVRLDEIVKIDELSQFELE